MLYCSKHELGITMGRSMGTIIVNKVDHGLDMRVGALVRHELGLLVCATVWWWMWCIGLGTLVGQELDNAVGREIGIAVVTSM